MADAQKIDRNLIDRILNPIFILYSRKKKEKKEKKKVVGKVIKDESLRLQYFLLIFRTYIVHFDRSIRIYVLQR